MIHFYININGSWEEVGITSIMTMIENSKIFDESGEEWIGTSSIFLNQFHRLYTMDKDNKLHGIEARLIIQNQDLKDQIETTDEEISNLYRCR